MLRLPRARCAPHIIKLATRSFSSLPHMSLTPVQFEGGNRVLPAAPSSHALLLDFPRTGPYSVVRASGPSASVFRLEQHVSRIALAVASSVAKLSAPPPAPTTNSAPLSAAAPESASAPVIPTPTPEFEAAIARALRDAAAPALTAFFAQVGSGAHSSEGGANASEDGVQDMSLDDIDIRVLYLLSPRADPAASAPPSDELSLALSTLSSASSASATPVPSTDALVAALNTVFSPVVHVGALPPRPRAPIAASARIASRPHGAVKDSAWVAAARGLEEAMCSDENEVVMVGTAGGKGNAVFSEGLSSNFFALLPVELSNSLESAASFALKATTTTVPGTQGEAHVSNGSVDAVGGREGPAKWALWTAREGVLLGTVRATALKVARGMGVRVVELPPPVKAVEQWGGCAVSSTSRLFLPVDKLRWPATGPGAGPIEGAPAPGSETIFEGEGRALLEAIKEGVDAAVDSESTKLLP